MKAFIQYAKSQMAAILLAVFAMVLIPMMAMAQETTPAVDPTQDLIAKIADAAKSFGGANWATRVGMIVLILIASMKVSALNDLIWSKLGALQRWVAPVLSLVGGLVMMALSGGVTLPGVLAYLGVGVGATYVHDLLDMVKLLPGIGPLWVSLITVIESQLGGPAASGK